MPSLANHQSNQFTKLLLIGDAKCVDGDTIIKVTRGRSIGRAMTIRDLYSRMQGGHYRFDPELATYLLCDTGGYAGLGQVNSVVYSGIKTVQTVHANGREIRATMDHRFLTDVGWKTLNEIKVGDWVKYWEQGSTGSAPAKPRVTIYSIPHHPNAMSNFVNGKDYKRNARARLVVEAAMNNIDFDDYIEILRNAPDIAATLTYLPKSVDVHHKNGDTLDDDISNLEVLNRAEHFEAESRGALSKPISLIKIEGIGDPIERHTYDISMGDEGHNFIANGFVVHNSGKTGSLVSLVKAGYKLRILDFDNLLDILKFKVMEECPDKLDNVEFVTVRDNYKAGASGSQIDGKPKAWISAIKLLDNWKYDDTDLGRPADWGPDCILIVDSLSRLCDAAYDFHESIIPRGKSGDYDGRAVYGNAQDDVEKVLAMLTSRGFATNLIVIAHGTYMDLPDGTTKIFPQGVGQKLSPKIPQYFPSYIRYKNKGGKRTIQTTSDAMIDLANPRPDKVDKELPIETGLATLFEALRDAPAEKPKSVTLVRK